MGVGFVWPCFVPNNYLPALEGDGNWRESDAQGLGLAVGVEEMGVGFEEECAAVGVTELGRDGLDIDARREAEGSEVMTAEVGSELRDIGYGASDGD